MKNINTRALNSRLTISAIAAVAANRTIGFKGNIPWSVPGEQAIFSKCTKGKAVVMGRATWESLPSKYRPLPNRLNIVLSSSPNHNDPDCIQVSTILDALLIVEAVTQYSELVFIGGQSVFEEGIPFCNKIYLTKLEGIYPGDRFFPELKDEWHTAVKTYSSLESNGVCGYTFSVLQRMYNK